MFPRPKAKADNGTVSVTRRASGNQMMSTCTPYGVLRKYYEVLAATAKDRKDRAYHPHTTTLEES